METAPMIIRWTVGNVSSREFETLRCSLWGAWRIFGAEVRYVVGVNTVAVDEAQVRTGESPPAVEWRMITAADLPNFVRAHVDAGMAEGVAWKLAPARLEPDAFELALDNDCVLWEQPPAVAAWRAQQEPTALLAEDVRRYFGRLSDFCGAAPRNSGIRGLPPHFDYEAALQATLTDAAVTMRSELDEQGLQVAALQRSLPTLVVTTEDVSICSPFPPHLPDLGRCGAHFVGQNARSLPWWSDGRPAVDHLRDHWARPRAAVARRVGCSLPTAAPAGG